MRYTCLLISLLTTLAHGEQPLTRTYDLSAILGGARAGPIPKLGLSGGFANAWGNDPEMATLRLGVVDAVRPIMSHDGQTLLVECRLDRADALSPFPRFDTGLFTAAGNKLTALEQPQVRKALLQTTVCLPSGGAGIVGVQRAGDIVRVSVVRHIPQARALPARARTRQAALRVFDVAFATHAIHDFRGPMFSDRPTMLGMITFSDDSDASNQLSISALLRGLRAAAPAASWDSHGLTHHAGWVLATQSMMQLDRLEAHLLELEQMLQATAMVRTRVLKPSAGTRRWFDRHGEGALSRADARRLARMLSAGKVAALDDLVVTGLIGQQVRVTSTTQGIYVSDHDIELALDMSGRDPVVTDFVSGSRCQVRPVLLDRGRKLRLELRRELSTLRLKVRTVNSARVQVADRTLFSRSASPVVAVGGAYLLDMGGRYLLIEVWLGQR